MKPEHRNACTCLAADFTTNAYTIDSEKRIVLKYRMVKLQGHELEGINMNCIFVIFIAVCMTGIATDDIHSKIEAYFESETTQSLLSQWRTIQTSYEDVIQDALRQIYGHRSMSVYINRFRSPLAISPGYYHTDNQVEIIFQRMGLEELPTIYDAAVSFPLSSNVLSFEASVSRMIVHTSYILFRNKSDIIFAVEDQDSRQSSPFRFQQVRNVGELAITLGGCTLSGTVIATLSGESVNLGHHQFRLTDCQHNIEIYSQGTGSPPVVAPYVLKGENGLSIEYLLLRPLLEELMPKLQAAMFSYVNTSSVFKELSKFQGKQESIFEETKTYLDQVVRSINIESIKKNMGTIKLDDFTIVWDDPFIELPNATAVTLFRMVLMGLDSIYSAHTGGPYKLTETEISESLRFGTLEVTGSISLIGFKADSEFAVEITDLAVDVTLDSRNKATYKVVGWRYLEFSCPKMEFLPVESFVVGYLLNEVPKRIVSYLNSVTNGPGSLLNHPLDEEPFEEEDVSNGIIYTVPSDEILKQDEGDTMDHVKVSPHVEEKEPVKLHHVKAVPHVDALIRDKRNKKNFRNKLNQTRPKKPTRIRSKKMKPLKLANKGSKPLASTKTIYTKDNKIRSI